MKYEITGYPIQEGIISVERNGKKYVIQGTGSSDEFPEGIIDDFMDIIKKHIGTEKKNSHGGKQSIEKITIQIN